MFFEKELPCTAFGWANEEPTGPLPKGWTLVYVDSTSSGFEDSVNSIGFSAEYSSLVSVRL